MHLICITFCPKTICSTRDYQHYEDKLIKKELETKYDAKLKAKDFYEEYLTDLKRLVSVLDFNHLHGLFKGINQRNDHTYLNVHRSKLFNLDLRQNFESLRPEEVIFNLS